MFKPNPLAVPSGTRRFREIRNAIGQATANGKPGVSHSITVHFFSDCWLGYHEKSQGGTWPRWNEKVYTKDGKNWLPYYDQFEPKEGFHHAVKYEPADADFPVG